MTDLKAPSIINATNAPSLRWGIIGTGRVAHHLTHAAQRYTQQKMVAVATRTPENAKGFAVEHRLQRAHTTIDELLRAPDLDAVYIATPHTLHTKFALRAIANGKHVLVEKPFATTAHEVQQVADAARRHGVLAMEAMWTRYLPQSALIRQQVESGALGPIRHVSADLGYRAQVAPEHRLFDPSLGGGAIFDLGIYALSFALDIVGEMTLVDAVGVLADTGVDVRSTSLFRSAGAEVVISTSLTATSPMRATVIGEEAFLEVSGPFFQPGKVTIRRSAPASETAATWQDDRFQTPQHGMSDQLNAFSAYVAAGLNQSPLHSLDTVATAVQHAQSVRELLNSASSTTDH